MVIIRITRDVFCPVIIVIRITRDVFCTLMEIDLAWLDQRLAVTLLI